MHNKAVQQGHRLNFLSLFLTILCRIINSYTLTCAGSIRNICYEENRAQYYIGLRLENEAPAEGGLRAAHLGYTRSEDRIEGFLGDSWWSIRQTAPKGGWRR